MAVSHARNQKPRLLSLTLVVGILVTLQTITPLGDARANVIDGCDTTITNAFGGGAGTQADPYLICNRSQLERIATNLTRYFLLKADINLGSAPVVEWTPISGTFSGVFDGGYKTISGLTITSTNQPSLTSGGLFATIGNGAQIRRLRITNGSIDFSQVSGTSASAGMVTGRVTGNATISEIVVTSSTIQGKLASAGALVGTSAVVTNARLTLDLVRSSNNSISSAPVSGIQGYVGGIVGQSRSLTMKRAAVQGTSVTVTSFGSFYPSIGGLVGYGNFDANSVNTISQAYVDSSLSFSGSSGETMIGGLVGAGNALAWVEIDNAIFVGSVSRCCVSALRDINGLIGFGGFQSVPQKFSNVIMAGDFGTLASKGISSDIPGTTNVENAASIVANGDGTVTYTTIARDHRFEVGDLVTITGQTEAGYNVVNAAIVSKTSNSFTITNATTAAPGNVTALVKSNRSFVSQAFIAKETGVFNRNLVVNASTGGLANTPTTLKSIQTYADASWSIRDVSSPDINSDNWSLSDASDPIWYLEANQYPKLVWMNYWPLTLAAPTNVTAITSASGVAELSWNAPTGTVTGYKIERSSDGGSSWVTEISNSGSVATTASISNLTPGSTQLFRVTAISANSFGNATSLDSNSLVMGSAPDSPTNLSFQRISDTTYRFTWNAPGDTGGLPLTGYLFQVDRGGGFQTISHSGTSADVPNLSTTSLWSVRVLASNVVGNSSYTIFTYTPPVPYSGPLVTSFSPRELDSTKPNVVRMAGLRLAQVSDLFIGSLQLTFARAANGDLIVTVPKLPSGVYDLRIVYDQGSMLTHQSALSVLGSVTEAATKSLLISNFDGDSSRLPVSATSLIKEFLGSASEVTKVRCIGSTSGMRVNARDRRLALNRAQAACRVIKKIDPRINTEVVSNPGSGVGPKFRSVNVQLLQK